MLPEEYLAEGTDVKRTACVFIRKEPMYRRAAIEGGLKKLGYTISDRVIWPSKREDLLVLWNKKRGAEEERADQWEKRGGTVIVMENGYLQQVERPTTQSARTGTTVRATTRWVTTCGSRSSGSRANPGATGWARSSSARSAAWAVTRWPARHSGPRR